MSDLFDPMRGHKRSVYSPGGISWAPPTDVAEFGDRIIIRMEVPGLEADEIAVTQENRRLTVQGRRRRPPEYNQSTYHILEIQYGPFARSFDLPASVDLSDITARYEDGFLTIELQKASQEPERVLQIRIKIQEKL